MLGETGPGTGVGACRKEGGITQGVEDEAMLGMGVDARRGGGVGAVTLWPQVNFPGLEPKGMCFVNALSTSSSKTKLSVVGNKSASPDAILWMCSISDLGSFSENVSWRHRISRSKIGL